MAELFWHFLIYSFLGFLLEVVFARVVRSRKQDRKCLYLLPLCPVYGVGALLITRLPAFVRAQPLLLLVYGALAATAAEYVMDWMYETFLRVRFWDYSARPWNLHGRVCLPFSLAWGALALALVRWVHPFVAHWSEQIPAGWILPALLILLADGLFTAYLLRSTGDTASLRWYDRFRRTAREHP